MMALRYIGMDYESYYCKRTGYSLTTMDNPSYICDPRFQATCVAIKEGNGKPYLVDRPDIPKWFKDIGDPSTIAAYGHNMLFDGCISSWQYGWVPALTVCTLVLARQLYAKDLRSLSLASVGKHLGLKPKGNFLKEVDGLRWEDIKARGLWDKYAEYAMDDIDIAHGILQDALPQTPAAELVIADSVMRMAFEPVFELDQHVLAQHLQATVNEKARLLQLAGCTVADLMSNDKFAAVLINLGVDPPMKISPATGKETWAFAKTDDGMKELTEHDDLRVQAVVAARLGHKTTQEETRTLRFINCANLNFPAYGTGLFPVPLKVSGAHTHRLSGEWKYNAQNLKRGGTLRKAIKAKKYHKIVVRDSSQIEARMAASFSGQEDLVIQFRDKLDPYSIMGTKIFGYEVTKFQVPERFIGKQCVLSAQYGVGGPKFDANIRGKSWEEVLAGRLPQQIVLGEAEAARIINTYRKETPHITAMRNRLNACIPLMNDPNCNFFIGPVQLLYQKIKLPSGQFLFYNNLTHTEFGWSFQHSGRWKRIYGGKLLENIIQALARIVVMYALLRLRKPFREYGIKIGLQCHDELVAHVPDQYVEWADAMLAYEMDKQIEWMATCPVASEGGIGLTYGDAK